MELHTPTLTRSREAPSHTGRIPPYAHVVDWDDENDPSNPFNWPLGKKWRITSAAMYVCFIVGINSTAIASATTTVQEGNDYWPVAAWNAGAAIAPLAGLPLMEHFGVRSSFLIYYVLFTIFVIPQAVADNFATLIVTRVIAGGLGGIVQNAVESVIADTWRDEDERNLPITLFVFVFIAGFTVGPIIGAAIASHLYWRWVFYIQLIIYAASFPFIFFLLKETRHSVILTKRAVLLEKRSSTGQRYYAAGSSPSLSPASIIYDAIIRPTRLFCTEPIVFFFTAWSAFAFGLVFISTQSIGQVYTQNYNFTLYQTGYVQTALLAGEALGCIACLPQNTYYLRSGARSRDGNPIPEARLPLSIPASFIGLAGGLFWYAWTSADPSLPWILPTVGLGFVGFGIMCVVHAVVNYLTDAYTLYAASAIAAEAFGENVLAAFLPLAAKRMYAVLGFGWASSLLGFAALGLSFAPIVLVWKGGEIRRRSRFLQRARGGRA